MLTDFGNRLLVPLVLDINEPGSQKVCKTQCAHDFCDVSWFRFCAARYREKQNKTNNNKKQNKTNKNNKTKPAWTCWTVDLHDGRIWYCNRGSECALPYSCHSLVVWYCGMNSKVTEYFVEFSITRLPCRAKMKPTWQSQIWWLTMFWPSYDVNIWKHLLHVMMIKGKTQFPRASVGIVYNSDLL